MWISLTSALWHLSSSLSQWKLEVKRGRQESNSLLTALQSAVCLTSAELSSSLLLHLSQCQSVYQHSFILRLPLLPPALLHSFINFFTVTDIFTLCCFQIIHKCFRLTFCFSPCLCETPFFSLSGLIMTCTEMCWFLMLVRNNVFTALSNYIMSWILLHLHLEHMRCCSSLIALSRPRCACVMSAPHFIMLPLT